jgi:type I restriction enzyme M protein
MSTQEVINKLWRLCDVLRDDGVTYHQYLNELTFILFIKMAQEQNQEKDIPSHFRWGELMALNGGNALYERYTSLLANISKESKNGTIQAIYKNASTTIRKPANLETICNRIEELEWFDGGQESLGDMYEGLLERNAGEKKSGAGQYFTPRVLIDVMVALSVPKMGERCSDPAAGTFGFMISVHKYLAAKSNDYMDLSEEDQDFQIQKALSGVELVPDAHRLALMNAKLHGLDPTIHLNDSLTSFGESLKGYDLVLANPPFGTKKGGERPSRTDFGIETANKQLNFLQHIYRSLKKDGKSRAAVVLPDNVLFEDGDGKKMRKDLMDKCDLHTILRLPTGIFYAAGVKTNVLFFTRGKTDSGNTKKVWFYDMRTDVPNYGKRTLFEESAFEGFAKAYTGGKVDLENLEEKYNGKIDHAARAKVKDSRWSCFTRKEIAAKGDKLALGEIVDPNETKTEDIGEPLDIAKAMKGDLEAMLTEINALMEELA